MINLIPKFFRPVPELTEADRNVGFRAMNGQAVFASVADGLASGGFLAAFALLLGASNFQIGVMTAIPFIVQPLQIFAVMVVERIRMRKIITVAAYFLAFAFWIPVALIPFFVEAPATGAVVLMLLFIGLRGMANAFVNTGWNSWLRDFVPQDIMGKFFAKRLQLATIASVVAAIAAAVYIDWWKRHGPAEEIFGYSYAMLLGSILFGFVAVGFMARMPEPQMSLPEDPKSSILKNLREPFRDPNFRRLINFTFMWNFVAHLAVPFFTVYMLVKLEMSLTAVVVLGVLSQIANVIFLRVWGPFVDQYGSKVVLSLSSSLYFLVILGWTFTTLPDKHAFTMPLLVILHMLIGVASAGINISTTTIRMKMAPRLRATSYLTAVSLAANIAAGISPLLGGAFADFFTVRELGISLEWIDPFRSLEFSAFSLSGFDFLFAIAFVLGLFTLGSLTRIREEGEVDPEIVMNELMSQTRQNLRVLNSVPGLSFVANFPVRSTSRRYPIPGLDVAVGVTAHQIALSIRLAAETFTRGRSTAAQMRTKMEEAVDKASQTVEDFNKKASAIALGIAQGAMQTTGRDSKKAVEWVDDAIRITLETLGKTSADPRDAIEGATRGAMAGAMEAKLDPAEVVRRIMSAARKEAATLKLPVDEINRIVAETAVAFSVNLPPADALKLKEALLAELLKQASDNGESHA